MNTIIKTIIKTFTTSSIVFYLTYLLITSVTLVTGIALYGSNNQTFNFFSSAAIWSPIFIIPWALAYGIFHTIILSALFLIDKRFFDKRFVVGSALYIYIAIISTFYGIKILQDNWFYQLLYVLIPLGATLIIMKKEKWIR